MVSHDDTIEADEILPPADEAAEAAPLPRHSKYERAFGPIIGGLIIDFLDLATFGPIGIFFGFLIGAAAGYWVASIYNFTMKQRLMMGLLAGAYCTMPFTEVVPVATVIGALSRFKNSDG